MKQDIKEISYSLSQAERIKAEKEQEKKLLNDLKQDIKYVLLGLIETYYQEKEDFFDILENEGIIREKAEQQIRDIKQKVKTQVIKNDIYITKEIMQQKYYKYDDEYISNLIEDAFIVEYKRFKSRQVEYKKLADEKATDIIFKDLCEYYDYLKNQDYEKKAILYVLEKNKSEIIEDLQKDNKNLVFTDKQYKKALKDVKDKYIEEITPKKEETAKIPMGWKIFLGLTVIEKIKKHL